MLSLDDFKANVASKPFLDNSKYLVTVTGPVGDLQRGLAMNCSNVSIPGRGFGTVEKFNHGPIRKIPYSEIYDDVTTTFYATENLEEKKFFNDWQLKIAGDDYYTGWYSEITGSVFIITLNKQGTLITRTNLIEAYPISIGDIVLEYAGNTDIPTFTVTWAYHHWEIS